MAVIKCKMCGGDLTIAENVSVAECEYCGTKQTVPAVDDEKNLKLYERANKLRINCEFDKAAGVYENIVADYPDEAEGYWGLILCRYGIEYVDDPVTGKKVPTCHRSSFDSIMDDSDFEMVMENSDAVSRLIYREEAKYIEEIRKGIIEVSGKEEPYDIFICYKETDVNGERTLDSVLAQDVYDSLTQNGYRVFFSRITLEDKLGVEYEPYIFAALNSAKIMLVFGTSYDHYNAVWVKNEWSRYLKLMAQDKSKHLIPCYRNIDAYDIPKEFAKLQAQDLGKVGATQDLLRGIQKILMPVNQTGKVVEKETIIVNEKAANAAPLLKRVFLFLEDGDWESADEYCEKVLDVEPENALAYLGKLMADYEVCTKEELRDCAEPFDDEGFYQKVIRFGSQELINELQEYNEYIRDRNETARLEGIYCDAVEKMRAANSENGYKIAADIFATILTYKDSTALMVECNENAETERKEEIYQRARQMQVRGIDEAYCRSAAELYESITDHKDALALYVECIKNAELAHKNDQYYVPAKNHMRNDTMRDYEKALGLFEKIPGWRDVDKQIDACNIRIEELKIKDAERLERERQNEITRRKEEKRAKKNKMIAIVVAVILCVCIGGVSIWNKLIIPNNQYNDAVALMDAGMYQEAIEVFELLEGYKDSKEKIAECKTIILDGKYSVAIALMNAEKYQEAIDAFGMIEGYKDSKEKIAECKTIILDEKYNEAATLMEAGKYQDAIDAFRALGGYRDSANKITECNTAILDGKYNNAIALMNTGRFSEAYSIFLELGDYKESVEKAYNIQRTVIKEKLQGIKVGDYVTFGKYEQDNNKSNGKEDVEWLVLDVKEGKALVISKCGLDIKPYNADWTSISWETCTLRKWLNEDFLSSTFTEMEREMIPTVTVSADKNPEYNTEPGNETQDKVFLLSIAEAENYFSADNERVCLLSDYVDALTYGRFKEGCYWWLRSPGGKQYYAADVDKDGFVFSFGSPVYIDNYRVVRPAIWLDFNP